MSEVKLQERLFGSIRSLRVAVPIVGFFTIGILYFVYVRNLDHSSSLFFYALLWATSALVFGRVLRRANHLPTMIHLRRSEYARVWDALSKTSERAAKAAAGLSSEEDLRTSGEEVASRIADAVSLRADEDVLEIGIGVGRVGWAIAQRCRFWTGCDVSANMISHTQKRLAQFANIRLVRLEHSELSEITNESVDVVYCTNALPHMDQQVRFQYVMDAYRILRPHGRLYIDTIALDSEEGWIMVKNNLAQTKAGLGSIPYVPIPSTPDELMAYFRKAGFLKPSYRIDGSLLIVTATK
jgi:SAM-dependent methyltransferase